MLYTTVNQGNANLKNNGKTNKTKTSLYIFKNNQNPDHQ